MNDLMQIFFHFLRKGLWHDDKEDKVCDISRGEWMRLFALAHEQAVTGLFIDGVSQTAMRPDEDIWVKWIAHLLHLEQMNSFMAERGSWWTDMLASKGIRAEIFKGTSVAGWYPHPEHRSYGDIDIVVTEGWDNLESLLANLRLTILYEKEGIAIYENRNTLVEFHPQWEHLYSPAANARYQEMCRESGMISKEMYLVSLILHLQRHFLIYGVGLKQVCDIAVMIRYSGADMDKTAEILRRLHTVRFSRLLFGFIEKYLGGSCRYPLPPDPDRKKISVMEDVFFRDGYRLQSEREHIASGTRNTAARIGVNAMFWFKRSLKLISVLPEESVCFLLDKSWSRMCGLFSRKNFLKT